MTLFLFFSLINFLIILFFKTSPYLLELNLLNNIVFLFFIIKENNQKNRLEKEIKKTQENNAKMLALGEVAAGIAHEINNPVAIVHGQAQLIAMQIEEARSGTPLDLNELEANNNNTLDTISRIDKIINSLRYFVKDDKRNPFEKTSPNEILDTVQILSIDRCKKNGIFVSIDKKYESDTILWCKPTQISQVLINLVNNSFDSLMASHQKDKHITISSYIHNKNIVFKVKDNGPGLNDDIKKDLLKSFYTSKHSTKSSGLGIGLTIVKRIIDQHNGEIFIEKEENMTVFRVEIPLEAKC